MVAKRIIPCLDVKDGQVVKGINFLGLKEVGDAVAMGRRYSEEGADELVYLDISATFEGRRTFVDLVSRIAREIDIPFTVGGGISSLDDAARLLDAGADKISINSAAIADPALISRIADHYGSQFVVVAIDARCVGMAGQAGHDRSNVIPGSDNLNVIPGSDNLNVIPGSTGDLWMATTHGGRVQTNRELFSWAREAQERGAGEILFTSMDHDGTKAGYALSATARLCETLSIPVIASGGAGNVSHIVEVLTQGKADAALAASIFHYGEIAIPALKRELAAVGIPVRL
jgi:cyclase